VRRDDDGFGCLRGTGAATRRCRSSSRSLFGTAWRSQPRSEVITKRFRNSVPKKGAKVGQNVAAESPGSLSGLSGLRWIFRGRQAKKLPLFRLDSNISERWQIKGDVGSCARNSKGLSPAPVALYAPQPAPTAIPVVASAPAYPPSPVSTAPAMDEQPVLVPVMINNPYHPHWMVGGSQ